MTISSSTRGNSCIFVQGYYDLISNYHDVIPGENRCRRYVLPNANNVHCAMMCYLPNFCKMCNASNDNGFDRMQYVISKTWCIVAVDFGDYASLVVIFARSFTRSCRVVHFAILRGRLHQAVESRILSQIDSAVDRARRMCNIKCDTNW